MEAGVVGKAKSLELCEPKTKKFGLPQSRSRLFILMVRDSLIDVAGMNSLAQVITETLPAQIRPGATLQDLMAYVEAVRSITELEQIEPPFARDSFAGFSLTEFYI